MISNDFYTPRFFEEDCIDQIRYLKIHKIPETLKKWKPIFWKSSFEVPPMNHRSVSKLVGWSAGGQPDMIVTFSSVRAKPRVCLTHPHYFGDQPTTTRCLMRSLLPAPKWVNYQVFFRFIPRVLTASLAVCQQREIRVPVAAGDYDGLVINGR